MEPTTIASITAGISAVGGFIVQILGGADILLYTLVLFIVIDVTMGVLMSVHKHLSKKTESGRFSSEVLREGLTKKFLCFIVIIIAVALDNLTGLYLSTGDVQMTLLRSTVIIFYIAYEGSSILENLALLGVPLPQKILDVLDVLRKDNDRFHKGYINRILFYYL